MTSVRSAPALLVCCLAAVLGLFGVAAPTVAGPSVSLPPERQILVLLRQMPDHLRADTEYGGGYGDVMSLSARERMSQRIARAHGLAVVGNWPMPLLGLDCFILGVPEGRSPQDMAIEVSRDPGVEWSQPMNVYHTRGSGVSYNDPLYRAQPAASQWKLSELHDLATGRGITVAVIDTRIDRTHPDLAGQIELSEDFASDHPSGPEQHGTGVAGIIAAKGGNGLGIVGIAPNARIMGLRACWQLPGADGSVCDSLSLAKALHFAIEHKAQVINLSLSGPPDPLLGRLLDVAATRGETVVAAFDPSAPDGGFPASHPSVIPVADEAMASLPPGVYTAPGRDIPTTEPGGRWYLVDGSSYAAAHVSGLFALLRERHGGAVRPVVFVSPHGEGGRIDALTTLEQGRKGCDLSCPRQLAVNAP